MISKKKHNDKNNKQAKVNLKKFFLIRNIIRKIQENS